MEFLRNKVNLIKRKYYENRTKKTIKKYREPLRVNSKSLFNNNTELGQNNNFNGMRVIGNGKVKIGDNFHSGSNCQIITQSHNYEGTKIPYDKEYRYYEIVIKDNVWLGNNVIIVGNITLGEGAIVQAGSVVVSNVPDFAIVGGNPATVFKYRNKDHYKELKKLGKFH